MASQGTTAMQFFKGISGNLSGNPAEPPPSVLAEWNKYSAGDIESQTGPSTQSSFAGWQVPWANSAPTDTQARSTAPSFRIPSGTEFVYFAAFIIAAIVFYFFAFFLFLPMLIISPSKFAMSFTFGSCCSLASMTVLSGWRSGLQHMLSSERLYFTSFFVGSMLATLYAAMVMHSYLLSIVFSGAQLIALLYYVVSYFPGGTEGLKMMLSMVGNTMYSCLGFARR